MSLSFLYTAVASRFQALVNRSLSRTCLRCVHGWDTLKGTVSVSASPAAPESIVGGVLVLLAE